MLCKQEKKKKKKKNVPLASRARERFLARHRVHTMIAKRAVARTCQAIGTAKAIEMETQAPPYSVPHKATIGGREIRQRR